MNERNYYVGCMYIISAIHREHNVTDNCFVMLLIVKSVHIFCCMSLYKLPIVHVKRTVGFLLSGMQEYGYHMMDKGLSDNYSCLDETL